MPAPINRRGLAGGAPYDYGLRIGTAAPYSLAGSGRDYLWGRAGADALSGGADLDQLLGNAGNDLVAGGDRLMGGAGMFDRLAVHGVAGVTVSRAGQG